MTPLEAINTLLYLNPKSSVRGYNAHGAKRVKSRTCTPVTEGTLRELITRQARSLCSSQCAREEPEKCKEEEKEEKERQRRDNKTKG